MYNMCICIIMYIEYTARAVDGIKHSARRWPPTVPEEKISIRKNNVLLLAIYDRYAYCTTTRQTLYVEERSIQLTATTQVQYLCDGGKKLRHRSRKLSDCAHTRQRRSCSIFFLIKNAENARDGGNGGKGKNHDRVNGAFV